MKNLVDNFCTSGCEFSESEIELKCRYQMLNMGILISIIVLFIRAFQDTVSIESSLIFINFAMIFILRKYKKSFEYVSTVMTLQYTFFFLYLIYVSEPKSLEHIWLFTYSIILLYFQGIKKGVYWFAFFILMLLIAPFQGFVEVKYTFEQLSYLSLVLVIINVIMNFYHMKMDEARTLIIEQQDKLRHFNTELEHQVKEKTAELIDLNESLEQKVKNKIEKLTQQDKLITAQSRQAVMGEMISMIAHQWRQPLSTITLQIADYQFKQLMLKDKKVRAIDKTLDEISNTIIYLSETIDDFQTYFQPDKELSEIEIHELIQKAVDFSLPRIQDSHIEIILDERENIVIQTYMNEMIQVLLNLINNAIDSLIEADKKEPKINIYIENKEGKILIYVKDNANGISDENVSKIFEPYFSTKGKNGTGLGLYMSQMIVQKQFNGSISVETSPEGSTFIVEISKELD